MPARRLGILGGTFDPVHVGHIDVGDAAHAALQLTDMVLVTSNVPPHRPQPLTSAYHRFAMVAIAVPGRPDWRASDLELRSDAPSYTSRTLERFHDRGYDAAELFFVIGADAFAEIAAWSDYPDILEAAHFAVVSRPGYPVAQVSERLPQLRARMVTNPGRCAGVGDPVDYFDRRADRGRVIDCDPRAAGGGRVDRRAGAGRACSNILSSTDFTLR